MNKKVLTSIAIVLAASVVLGSLLIWSFWNYETTVLALTYETEPEWSSPLSSANYSWEAKAYSAHVFGNSPFGGNGHTFREGIMSENRFRYSEFHNLNVSLRLRFQITNGTGYLLCNETLETIDGCDRWLLFGFRPDTARAGNALQIRIALSLNVRYQYGTGMEDKQFTLEKEWTRTLQIQQSEPAIGEQF